MALGIFEQLALLNKKVNRLCCAIKNQGLTSTNVYVTDLEGGPGYTITESGIYQFYGGTSIGITLTFASPTSAGQTIYVINTSIDTLTMSGLTPFIGPTGSGLTSISTDTAYHLISMEDATSPGNFIWRAFSIYPNAA
jgi:hypothetical protein